MGRGRPAVRPDGPVRLGQRLVDGCVGPRDCLEPQCSELVRRVIRSRLEVPVVVVFERAPHLWVVAAVQLMGEVVVLGDGQMLDQPAQRERGRLEPLRHLLLRQPEALPRERPPVPVHCREERLHLRGRRMERAER